MPTDDYLNKYYQGFNFLPPREEDFVSYTRAISRSLNYFVGKPRGSGRFLDYGGGSGIYCKAAASNGWQAELFDLDRNMLSFARNRLGVKQTWDNFDQISTRTFEVIFAFHVIEHWNGIEKPLESLLGLLEPGGRIVFATPNARSVEKFARPIHYRNYFLKLVNMGLEKNEVRRVLDKVDSILCWDPPRHLFAFTPESLRALGRRLGLETQVFTGYNTSAIYDPRRYIIPRLVIQLRQAYAEGGGRRGRCRAIVKVLSNATKMFFLRIFYPSGGEQLYVRFRKAVV